MRSLEERCEDLRQWQFKIWVTGTEYSVYCRTNALGCIFPTLLGARVDHPDTGNAEAEVIVDPLLHFAFPVLFREDLDCEERWNTEDLIRWLWTDCHTN